MPANTSHGLPYPLPTEPVAEGAQAIRNLAEGIPLGRIFDLTTPSARDYFLIDPIPPGYAALLIVFSGRSSHAGMSNLQLYCNGDAGANYDTQRGEFNASNAFAQESLGWTYAPIGLVPGSVAPAGACGAGKILIPNYAGTVFHKHGNAELQDFQAASASNFKLRSAAFRWRNTAAITRISLDFDNGQWITGSRVTAYVL